MSNQEQTSAVKRALDLSVLIEETEDRLSDLSAERFRSKPAPPSRQTVTATYPEIKPNTPFWTTALLPALVCWPWIIIYYFTTYKKNKARDIENIRNSDEYRSQCAAIDNDVKQKQAAIDEKYQAAMKEYNEITVPKYEEELAAWSLNHTQEMQEAQSALEYAEAELSAHYESTKIIPLQYRDIEPLEYIYDMISTSDYSVRDAIEMYDKERQRRMEEERIREQQRANRLTNEQIQLAYEQNELLEQQNSIAARAEKDARNAAIVGTVQRHNTNKMLKDRFKKK